MHAQVPIPQVEILHHRLEGIMRYIKHSSFVAALLLVHAALLAWAATRHSPVVDEVGHLPSGLSHLELQRFELYRVNPPLVRSVAALPLLFTRPEIDWTPVLVGSARCPEFELGREFISANGSRAFWLFTLARWECIPFSLVGAIVCYLWARELHGHTAGMLALILWCFCPNILGNAQTIMPDTAGASFGIAAAYCFARWRQAPSCARALLAGVFLGLAEISKATWIVLYPLWPILWLLMRVWGPPRPAYKSWRMEGLQLLTTILLSLYITNQTYLFDGSFQKLGDFRFMSSALTGRSDGEPRPSDAEAANRFVQSWLSDVPIPLPRQYVLGIDEQKLDFERKPLSYLGGEWRSGGWWYYYLYAMAIKIPLGTWILLMLACAASLAMVGQQRGRRDDAILAAHMLTILALVSSQTGLNHHLRYVLPVFPLLFVWTSKIAPFAFAKGWRVSIPTGLALTWSVVSSLAIYPHSLSYFNELAGGPTGGSAELLHSNIDYGQDLLYLKRWLDEHPEARPLGLAYYGYFDPHVAGIEFTLPPKDRFCRKAPGQCSAPAMALPWDGMP